MNSVYRVWSMSNYSLLFTISATDVHEVKIGYDLQLLRILYSNQLSSHGVLLVIMRRQTGHVPVKVLSIEDGSVSLSNLTVSFDSPPRLLSLSRALSLCLFVFLVPSWCLYILIPEQSRCYYHPYRFSIAAKRLN